MTPLQIDTHTLLNALSTGVNLWHLNSLDCFTKFNHKMLMDEITLQHKYKRQTSLLTCHHNNSLNPYPAKFLKWNNPTYIFGNCPLSFVEISRWELEVGQPTVSSLVRLDRSAHWPGSILVTKTNLFRRWQKKIINCLILKIL